MIGAVSVILWSLILVVSIKYAILIMRADNRGEGGIVACWRCSAPATPSPNLARRPADLRADRRRSSLRRRRHHARHLGPVRRRGLKVDAPALSAFVLPITVGVLIALFLAQRFGTGSIGRIFGPIMLVWFAVLALLGPTASPRRRRSCRP